MASMTGTHVGPPDSFITDGMLRIRDVRRVVKQWNGNRREGHPSAQHASLPTVLPWDQHGRARTGQQWNGKERRSRGKTETRSSLTVRSASVRLSAVTAHGPVTAAAVRQREATLVGVPREV